MRLTLGKYGMRVRMFRISSHTLKVTRAEILVFTRCGAISITRVPQGYTFQIGLLHVYSMNRNFIFIIERFF